MTPNKSFTFFMILFLMFLVGSVEPTRFEISGTIQCMIYGWFCFRIALFEMDSVKSDLIDYFGVRCTDQMNYNFFLNGTQFGDGYMDKFYELELWITHNCTTNRKIYQMKKGMALLPVTQDRYNRTLDHIRLKEVGDIVESYVD